MFSGPISSTPSSTKKFNQPPAKQTLNPSSTCSLVILFILDEDEKNILLETKTNFLPCVQLENNSNCDQASCNLPFLTAHKLLDLENLVFKELLEVRLHQNTHKLPDYVLLYQESNLPITAEPRYSWTSIKDIPNAINTLSLRQPNNISNLKFTTNENNKILYSPEISYLLDNYFRQREEKMKLANLSKLSSRSVSPRPKHIELSPSQNSNSSLMADLLNDDSCGEWVENTKMHENDMADDNVVQNGKDDGNHPLQYTDLLVQNNVRNSFLYQIATWQYNRPESIFIRKKMVKKLDPKTDLNNSKFENSRSDISKSDLAKSDPTTFSETTSAIHSTDIPKLFQAYTTAAFPSLYLNRTNFIKYFSDKNITVISPESADDEEQPGQDKILNRLFWLFNREFYKTELISFLDFSTCCQLLTPVSSTQSEQHKTARMKAICRFYSNIEEHDSPFNANIEKCAILTYSELTKIVRLSFELTLKRTLTNEEVETNVQSIYAANLQESSDGKHLQMKHFLETKFRQISSLLKFSADPLVEPLPQLGSKRNSTVAELSFTDSTIPTVNDSKRVRFGDSDITEVSENLKSILTSQNSNSTVQNTFSQNGETSQENKPVKKRAYRLATHCLTIHDGRIAHDKTEYIYDIGRGQDALADIDIDQEPRYEADDIPLPFRVAKILQEKTTKALGYMKSEDDKENSKPGSSDKTTNTKTGTQKKMLTMAERNLTVNTFCHYKSIMVHGFNESPAYQLLEGLRYFERRHRPSDKKPFSWDDQVDMEAFGKCAIQVIRTAKQIFMEEDRCLNLKSPCWVMGDLHGNYPNLHRYEQCLWKMGLSISTQKFLFLGDYVDRGEHGIEVVFGLLAQKVVCKDKIFLIRGNHELRNIQKYFSFHAECKMKFGDRMGHMIWEEINKAFDHLPIAAVVDEQIFCVHGGIPRPSVLSEDFSKTIFEEMNSAIDSPMPDPENECPLAWDLLWSDPKRDEDVVLHDPTKKHDSQEEELYQYELLEKGWNPKDIGFGENVRRQTAAVFDQNALQNFLDRFGLTQVIRAHEVQRNGFKVYMEGKLLTVFSASNYCNRINDSACIQVNDKTLRFVKMVKSD